ncbi:MAG TPA: DUF4190 domain-containing protein [Pyrinomonadaceae bacterium]|jgi:hypothetical protein|nr:DUF4190 domain-containing protein [Pyrinomonadaceae bacterium]
MTEEQTIAASATEARTQGAPPIVKSIALFLLVTGPLLAIWDVVAIRSAVTDLKREIPDALLLHYFVNLSIYIDLGVLFVVGGLGLMFNRAWGRNVGYFAAFSCFIAWFAAFALGGVVKRLVEEGEIRVRPKPLFFHFDLPLSITLIGPLIAFTLLVLLSLPVVSRWARSRPRVRLLPNAKLSAPAIGSFICSLVPILPFSQVVSLALGVSSLVQIKKSNGNRRGKVLAVAGIVISLWLMALIAALALAVFPPAP